MLRYRVAAMIWMFMLLGAAYHGGLEDPPLAFLWATLALASSYVAATAINDVADQEIDRINHPGDRGRPLVTGEASERDLHLLHGLAALLALTSAAIVGRVGLGILALSLAIGLQYSLPPLRLSYRTYLAPLVLSIAYVLIPYALGLAVAGAEASSNDLLFGGALVALFLARINLKDFRDREGDSRMGRPTLLLRFGKTVTCAVSLAALVTSDVFLLAALQPRWPLAILLELYLLGITWMLFSLWRSTDARSEQVAIGIGARMGNGLLITILSWLVLDGLGAPFGDQVALAAAVTALFTYSSWALIRRPDEAIIGYKA